MSRRQRASLAPSEHPTRRTILDAAVKVLLEDGFDKFNVQKVLDTAQVSRPTLYRHFDNVDNLIENALVVAFGLEADRWIKGTAQLIENSPDLASFRVALRHIIGVLSNITPIVRHRRAHALVLAATRPEFAEAIATIQESLTDSWEEAVRAGQTRGYARTDIDTRAISTIIQAATLGRILDDASVTHVSNDDWAQAFFDLLDRAVLVPAT